MGSDSQLTLIGIECSDIDSDRTHRLACRQWGNPDNPKVLLCVHGVARNARDFDTIAAFLSSHYRVLCPDMAGRGDSEWLADPSHYAVPQYMADIKALFAALNISSVDYLGTSMGGIVGMCLASEPSSLIHSLLLNDIGPFVSQSSLAPIAQYLGAERFADTQAALAYVKMRYQSWGELTPEQWQKVAIDSTRAHPDGGLCLHYDPEIAVNARLGASSDLDLWALWQAISCPVGVLRGQDSTILTADTLVQMQHTKPGLESLVLPGVGHVPPLLSKNECDWVARWYQQHGKP